MSDELDDMTPAGTGSTPTDAHLAMNALLTRIALEVARRRQDDLGGLLESLQDNVLLMVGGTTKSVLGQFAAGTWRLGDRPVHELFLNGDRRGGREAAISDAEDMAVTLLHECCHVYAQANDIKDTSRAGRWHNHRFGQIALAIGLHVTKDGKIGHRTPQLSTWGRADYADLLDELTNGLLLVREPQLRTPGSPSDGDSQSTATTDTDTTSTSKSKYVFASCRCRTDRGFRTGRFATGSWQPGAIWCRECGGGFEESRTNEG